MSLVTYTAVIAVRYPELDNVQNDLVCFGNYLLGEQGTSGGFLSIFWDAPSAHMHAATDIGAAVDWLQRQVTLSSDENGCLAVLHNRNKMVATFGNSEWVTQSEGAVQSKSVTSCAGMTAHFVLLAQTKVGFLSGGRSRRMKELPENLYDSPKLAKPFFFGLPGFSPFPPGRLSSVPADHFHQRSRTPTASTWSSNAMFAK